jgi:hypothetical protein
VFSQCEIRMRLWRVVSLVRQTIQAPYGISASHRRRVVRPICLPGIDQKGAVDVELSLQSQARCPLTDLQSVDEAVFGCPCISRKSLGGGDGFTYATACRAAEQVVLTT